MTKTATRRSAVFRALIDTLEARMMFVSTFGVTTGTAPTGQPTYVVDNGGNIKFSIIKGGSISNTLHLGDLSSLQYKGKELLATYATTSRYSHYEQGLGSTTVINTYTGGTTGSRWILVACDDSSNAADATQYYAVRENDNNLYLLSLPTDVNSGPGEGRFIVYLDRSVFTTPELPTDNAPHSASDAVTAIEGSDVYGHTDGASTVQTTSSKFYGMGRRMIDNVYHGLTGTASGTAVGAYMFMGNREHSAGGPFMKDIDYQSWTGWTEMYNCIFTGHTQTESYRQGLHTYALQLTGGTTPTTPDYSWLENVKDANGNLLINGLIPAAQRGSLAGTASGMISGHQTTIGLANSTAQYWAYANSTTGAYTISGIQPGTYTETIYDNELEVGRKTVTVAAGQTTSANIANSYYNPTNAIFRIGTWDGTPIGFLNTQVSDTATGARAVEIMHPSDTRLTAWDSTLNFVVGTNTDSQWPAYQFMGVNNSQRITFNLTAAQVQNLTLRVGITWDFSGARPEPVVNAGQTYAWQSAYPTASTDLNSRGITRGTWRGVNQLYTFPIPSTALRAGTNTIDLPLISGSYTAGQTWLSPNVSYDAIDLVPTTTATAPAIASVTVTPTGSIGVNGTRTFTAVAKDASGNVISADFNWSAALGTIDANGNYTAPATGGVDTITATAATTGTPGYNTTGGAPASPPKGSTSSFTGTNSASGIVGVTVLGVAPTVLTAASGTPNPSYTKQAALTVAADDDGGESNLTYTWSTVGTPPAAVTFSGANGTNAGKSTVATFAAAGTYTLLVTINDTTGHSSTSQTTVVVKNADTRYEFDDSATSLTDASGNANTAALTGTTSYAAGKVGNALVFGGGNAQLPNGIVSGLNNFTIGAWVNPSATQSWGRLFDFGTGTTNYMFFTPRTSTGVSRFAIKANGGTELDVDGPALAVNTWTHVAITLSGNTATLYINGVAVTTNANITQHPAALGQTTANYLGKSQFTADPALLGSVDDFRLYSTALTAADVNAWIQSATAPAVVTPIVVDDNTGQRSLVRSLTVNFSQPVTLASDAFSLTRRSTTGGAATSIPIAVNVLGTSGTSYQITFTGSDVVAGSLADGRYDLTINAASVTNTLGLTPSANTTLTFTRLFGDADGDGGVSINDFNTFSGAFGKTSGATGYNAAFDYDGDNGISINDFNQFSTRFGTTV